MAGLTKDTIWLDGFEAAAHGHTLSSNPMKTLVEAMEWARGWYNYHEQELK